MFVVETCNRGAKWLDTGGRTVLSSSGGDRNALGAGETPLDLIVGLGGTLAEIGPFGGILCVAVFRGTLCAPDYTGRGTGGVKAGMRAVAFVGSSELAMSFGLEFFSTD